MTDYATAGIDDVSPLISQDAAQALLAVAQEIAHDSRCDLVDSERRLRLYWAIQNAGGEL